MPNTNWSSDINNTPFLKLTDEDVIRLVNKALSDSAKHTTTYKYAFFKSLLDNIFNVDLDTMFLSYEDIAFRFTEVYWNLVLRYKLRQMRSPNMDKITSVEKSLFAFCDKYNFNYSIKETVCPFESLNEGLQKEVVKKIYADVRRFVLGAFCGDTEDQFYHFNKKDGSTGITLNSDVYRAFVKYKSVFERQNYFEWIKYMEEANREEDSYALAVKLDASTRRNNLSAYRQILTDFNQTKCFYCGKVLNSTSEDTTPVDHFIPWSFVKDDKIWNFVLACPVCNSSKSNIIPAPKYFDFIKERNTKLCNVDSLIVQQDFKNYSYFKLEEMWHSAVYNGFHDNWCAK